ncbi:DUF6924 domain-containing protein [Streptomyces viridiviolaceus]
MKRLPKSDDTLLVRTDFSDEAAWQSLRTSVSTPTEGDEGFLAVLHIVDDPAYDGLTTDEIVALAPAEDDLLIVADKEAMTGPGMPLLAVRVSEADEDGEDGQEGEEDERALPGIDELRVVAQELWAVENNISLANMDWEEFVEAADEDGVFRGF